MPAAVNGINHNGHLMLPAAVNPFSAAGTGARHGEATINRDLSFVADANARCGKRKVPVMVKQLCSSGGYTLVLLVAGLLCTYWRSLLRAIRGPGPPSSPRKFEAWMTMHVHARMNMCCCFCLVSSNK